MNPEKEPILSPKRPENVHQKKATQFVTHLHNALSNTDFCNIVFWDKEGSYFIIAQLEKFSELVLPFYYRHNKFSSFVRQLNMYGFRKRICEEGEVAYYHPSFTRDAKGFLYLIERSKHFRKYGKVTKESLTQESNIRILDVIAQNNVLQEEQDALKLKISEMQQKIDALATKNAANENKLLQLKMKMDWCSFGPPEMQDIYQLPENRQLSLKKIKKEELKPSLLPDMNINIAPSRNDDTKTICSNVSTCPNTQVFQYYIPAQMIDQAYIFSNPQVGSVFLLNIANKSLTNEK